MRILFVVPYPPSRIRVRSYEFLVQLQKHHDVTVVTQCVSEQEHADVEGLRKRGYEVVEVNESKRKAALRSGLVHVEHLRGIASMKPLARMYPLVWDAVDCISLLSKHTMSAGPSFSVRAIARLECNRTRRYEACILEALQYVVVTSDRDRQAMIGLRRMHKQNRISSDDELGAGITVLPNGVDLDYFHPMHEPRRRLNLVFSGKMSYHANIATALYLHQHIMPLIWKHRPEATLTIVGSKPPKIIQNLARDRRIEVTGYVEDIRTYVGRAEVMLSPMVYSVGIQNKVLEAMALGTPVAVTTQVAEALNARPGQDLLVAESAQEFAAATLRLLDDADFCATLSRNGRCYVEQAHDWEVVAERLVMIYRRAIAAHTGKILVAEEMHS